MLDLHGNPLAWFLRPDETAPVRPGSMLVGHYRYQPFSRALRAAQSDENIAADGEWVVAGPRGMHGTPVLWADRVDWHDLDVSTDDRLPEGLTFLSADPEVGTYDGATVSGGGGCDGATSGAETETHRHSNGTIDWVDDPLNNRTICGRFGYVI